MFAVALHQRGMAKKNEAGPVQVVKLHLDRIRLDGGTQQRAVMNQETVADYAAVLSKLPPVVVFFDGADHWLVDGFHRVAAHRQAGATKVSAEVRPGTQREAVLHSVGANAANGLRRTNLDKRRAVETLLKDEQWRTWTDNRIAKYAGVSHEFVRQLRPQVATVATSEPAIRTGSDGKSYPAGKSRTDRPEKRPEDDSAAPAVFGDAAPEPAHEPDPAPVAAEWSVAEGVADLDEELSRHFNAWPKDQRPIFLGTVDRVLKELRAITENEAT